MVADLPTDKYPRFWTIALSLLRHLRTLQVATIGDHAQSKCCVFNTQHRSTLPIPGPVLPSGDRFQAHNISRSTCCVFNTQHRSALPMSSHSHPYPAVDFEPALSHDRHAVSSTHNTDRHCKFRGTFNPFKMSISSPYHITIDTPRLQHATPIHPANV